jgi:hypothetical protein
VGGKQWMVNGGWFSNDGKHCGNKQCMATSMAMFTCSPRRGMLTRRSNPGDSK